jgi:hypothetical protein
MDACQRKLSASRYPGSMIFLESQSGRVVYIGRPMRSLFHRMLCGGPRQAARDDEKPPLRHGRDHGREAALAVGRRSAAQYRDGYGSAQVLA